MKKMAIAGVLIAGLTTLVACEDVDAQATQEPRMQCVERTSYGEILCDNRTGVVYFAYKYGGIHEAYSGVCVMVDQNGQLLVMEESK